MKYPLRRHLLKTIGLAAIATQLPVTAKANQFPTSILKPPRLKVGDTVGLINPASPIQSEDIEQVKNTLSALGLKVKLGAHLLSRYGYLAGSDADRASDVNAMFADSSVQAILTMRGGWGCNRILPLLDYPLIRKHPKILMGYSDITSLLVAIYTKSGVVTFHGPVGTSTWNDFTVNYVKRILFDGEAVTMQNPINTGSNTIQYFVASKQYCNLTTTQVRGETITEGKARGKLVGGNLSVLAAMVGSPYLPAWKQTILFLEETGEEPYRVDRMLTQLKLAGILEQISGFVFGQCTKCDPENASESLSLTQVLREHILPLSIPSWYGSMIGHIQDKFTVPVGVEVEIDARAGTIQLLEKPTV